MVMSGDPFSGGRPSRRRFLKLLGAAGGMVALSSVTWGCISSSSTDASPRPTGNITYTVKSQVQGKFATFQPMSTTVNPSLGSYGASDLSKVALIDNMGVDDAGKQALSQNLFYMRPSTDAQIYDVYKSLKDAGQPAFVTTDSVLHTYHILFDYSLRILEVDKFSPALIDVTKHMLAESITQMNSGVAALATPATKNVAFFGVAISLLGESPNLPPQAEGLVEKELSLINGHAGAASSPIFGYEEDYSQYVPRGHYTRNDTLKNYFKAMMWFGRMSFRIQTTDMDANKEQTRMAIMITLALKDVFDQWKSIYEPTVFYVGEADDLTVFDYNQLIIDVYGNSMALSDLADDTKLMDFIGRASKLKSPKIQSTGAEQIDETKGFRFMGQRFIPDSYMFQELVYDKVSTLSNPRYFPMGLDVMAVLGSARAYELLDKVYDQTQYDNYAKQMESLKAQFAAFKDDTWTQNLYWCWLYCLMALLNEKGDGYPSFMKSTAWTDKELDTSLGSWTELRHDTILYAKQSYATLGMAMPPQTKPHGYVEPNPELYGRLSSLVSMTSDGLKSRGLLLDEFADKLTSLNSLLASLKAISEKELTNASLSDDEYSLIENVGGTLQGIITFSSAVADEIESDTDQRMAVVADVHTDLNTNQVLEEGVGNPEYIFVIVPVNGSLTLTKGAAFSYFEFKQPVSDRLTDEAWQQMLTDNKAPEAPSWTKSFTA